jgi:erythronate-4-phosphate dehydrogenase
MMRRCVKWRGPGEFDKLRKNYQERRMVFAVCACAMTQAATLLRQLGFNAVHHPVR